MQLTPEAISLFCEEARHLNTLRHSNIIHMVGVCVCPPSLCIVLELCDLGNLMEYVKAQGDALPLAEQLYLCVDCCRAVSFLHAQPMPIIHGDIKRCVDA